MQLKLALRTLATTALTTTALAMPSSPPAAAAAAAARDNGMPAPPINYDIETTGTDDIHWPRDDSFALLEARAPTKWQAAGGCRTDWGGNCLNKCKAEAPGKGVTCPLGSTIWKSDCWLGWSVCTCYCKAT